MKTKKLDRSWSRRMVRAMGASALAMTVWSAGASAQLLNGDFSSAPPQSPTLTEINNTTNPLPNWTLTGGNSSGIDCVILTAHPVAGSTPMCGTSYLGPPNNTTATLTQVPPASGAGALPASYTGKILVADAFSQFAQGISQTINNLTAGSRYNLTFFYSGAQQSGFTGTSQDHWQVSFGATAGTAISTNTPDITIPTSPGSPVWAQQTVSFTTTTTSEYINFLAQGNAPANEPPFMLLADLTLTRVPEPASLGLLGLGLAGLAGLRRRARGRTAAA